MSGNMKRQYFDWIGRAGLGALPLLTYPIWSRFLFYKPFGATLAMSAGLLLILFQSHIRFFELLPGNDQKAAWALGIAAYLLYAAAALGVFGDIMDPTGDEPNYLLATISLYKDHDIRLKNNFNRRDYLEFYPGKIVTRVVQGRDRGGYPVHGIGVSLYLFPYYYIGSKIGGPFALRSSIRLGMALIAACLAASVFLLLRRLAVSRPVAFATAGILAFSPPLIMYAHLAYPETSVALIVTLFFMALFSSQPRWAFCGLLLSACPWFGVKFNAMAAALAGTAFLAIILRTQAAQRFRACLLTGVAALPLLAAYEFYLWRFYGSFSPAAAVGGRATAEKDSVTGNIVHYLSLDTFKRLRYMPQTFLADLIDQKGGILLYSPILLIAILGLWILFRDRNRTGLFLILPPLMHLGIYTYTNYMGGFCPPGRPILPLLPIIAILFAHGLPAWKNAFTRTLLLFFSAAISLVWLSANPFFYHRLIYSEERVVTNFALFIDGLPRILPVMTAAEVFEWRNVAILASLFALLLLTARRGAGMNRTAAYIGAAAAVFLPVILIAAQPKVCQRISAGSIEFQFIDGWPAYPESEGFWLRGSRSGRIRIVSNQKLDRLVLPIRDAQDLMITSCGRDFRPESPVQITIDLETSSPGPPYVHPISFRIRGGFHPSDRDPNSLDQRWLGVFIVSKEIGNQPGS